MLDDRSMLATVGDHFHAVVEDDTENLTVSPPLCMHAHAAMGWDMGWDMFDTRKFEMQDAPSPVHATPTTHPTTPSGSSMSVLRRKCSNYFSRW